MQEGQIAFDIGQFFTKGLAMVRTGKRQSLQPQLRDLIHAGKATPSWIVSHHLPLDQGPTRTNTSTRATTAGRRSSYTPRRRDGEAGF